MAKKINAITQEKLIEQIKTPINEKGFFKTQDVFCKISTEAEPTLCPL
jgi:hypothetical protein